MAFEDVISLFCKVTIALGGTDKKSGKKNPTQLTGYFLGSKKAPSKKSKTGLCNVHVFQTKDGNVGVWGKTDLDAKMLAVKPGQLTRVLFVGMIPTDQNDMYEYKVQIDKSQTIKVELSSSESAGEEADSDYSSAEEPANTQTSAPAEEDYGDEGDESGEGFEEEPPVDEAPPARATKPARPAASPDAARQARVRDLVTGGSKRSAA